MTRRTSIFTAVIAGLCLLLFPAVSSAQDMGARAGGAADALERGDGETGDVTASLPVSLRRHFMRTGTGIQQAAEEQGRRNVALAFGLSAVAPGAGQIYNRDWIKAGIGIALEAAMWTGYVFWKREGESRREDYRAYAHEHYNPVRYAEWLNEYPGYQGQPIPTESVADAVDFTEPDSWSAQERQQVRHLIDAIQDAEQESSFADPPHAAFSHQLPHFGEQQYYELIGKYHQYAAGWDDCGEGCGVKNPSERFFEYAEIHGEANTLLRRASRVTALIVINHGLAAIDAAITSQLYNNSLDTEVSLQQGMDGTTRPYVTMKIAF